MLAGMYVVRDETPTLVARLTGHPAGPVLPGSTTYHLRALTPEGLAEQTTYLRNPLATDVPLLPACETGCGARAGQPCYGQNDRTKHDRPWSDEMAARAVGVTNTTTVPVRDHGF